MVFNNEVPTRICYSVLLETQYEFLTF